MRQNIDEEWKTDPRREALVERLKDSRLADGARVQLNWLILDHKGEAIPLKKFKFLKDHEAYIECGLAVVHGDKVHIAGADRYREFFERQKENGSKGGRPKKTQKNPEKPSDTQKKPGKPSFSFSSSISISKEENIYIQKWFEVFVKDYKSKFPGTVTGPKAKERFFALIRTPEKFDELNKCTTHYHEYLSRPENAWRAPKQSIATYLGSESSGYFYLEFKEPVSFANGGEDFVTYMERKHGPQEAM